MRLTQNLKTQLTQYCSMILLFEKLLCDIHCFTISICDSVSQFNDGANWQREDT